MLSIARSFLRGIASNRWNILQSGSYMVRRFEAFFRKSTEAMRYQNHQFVSNFRSH